MHPRVLDVRTVALDRFGLAGEAGRATVIGSGRPWESRAVRDDRPGDFDLTMDELRVVARFAAESAQEVLAVYEDAHPGDLRPRQAVDAAWAFVHGAARTNLQRVTASDAHRAAREASTEAAALAARAAGDAAAAAYLHPIAKATQVGHILRATASAARIAELRAGDDPAVGIAVIEQARQRATPTLLDVLGRYPVAPAGAGRAGELLRILDSSLRSTR